MADTDTNQNKPEGAEPELQHNPLHSGHIEADLPKMRTFAEDLAVEIQRKGTTSASIVEAERARAARAALMTGVSESEPRRRTILTAATVVLVGAGVLGLIAAYVAFSWPVAREEVRTPSIISTNSVLRVVQPSYESLPDTLGLARKDANLPLGDIEEIVLTLAAASSTPAAILAALNAPEPLAREATSVMLGFHSFNRTQPFIIIRIAQYDRAFAAMLRWEEEMARSLGTFFEPALAGAPPTLAFRDAVVRNTDARISPDSWPILWTFVRRDVLVITTNQYTLSEILARLAAQPSAVQ
ncbi:hypothetical protein KGO06_02155 [Patescibacteria group bacterium]|nr:hypothetical protein [Patescibacteria group bacterium]